MGNRAGTWRQQFSGRTAYKSFVPAPLPPDPPIELSVELVVQLVRAHRQLAALESVSARIPDMPLFVSMYVRKEALMSSQIEGTQATLEDIFDPLIDANANGNVADVVNYVKATEYALKRLETLPLCSRLLRETHAVLMEGVRGEDKCPGEFRHSQNWIGGPGSTLKTARHIPPPPEDMDIAISDLEKFFAAEAREDVLIRAALIHYQFETIHPFLDGNGRIGRLLITLYLMERKVLTTPALYISYFLKRNRIEYYDRMTEVRESGNFEQWVFFFLQAVEECARDAIETIDRMTALHTVNAALIAGLGRASKNVQQIFRYLEANPIIDIQKTAQALDLSFNTVSAGVGHLLDLGILQKTGTASRNRTFVYQEYLEILRDGT